MQAVITVATMRESDAYTIANFVPSKTLMYRAAMGVYQAAQWKGPVGILTGGGNNGVDGYALAGILADHGIPCTIYRVSETFSEDGGYYHTQAVEKGVPSVPYTEETDLSACHTLVDCLLGTGFSGEVRGLYRHAIQAMNQAEAYVVSVDINSGMNGDTGKGALVVQSNLTVTIGFLKVGMLLGDAVQKMDQLAVADIGIRLIREDDFLAHPEEVVFSRSGLSLEGPQERLSPEAVEKAGEEGNTLPETARALALRSGGLIRVSGKYPLVTDGYQTYFLEAENAAIPVLNLQT